MPTVVEYIIELKDKLSVGLNKADNNVKKLDKSVNGLSNTVKSLGIAFGAMEAVNLAKSIATLGMENEKTKITFGVLLGGAEQAKTAMEELYGFASTTPFEIEEVKTAAKSMLAYGFSQKELIPEMKKLGDVAAGLNIPFNDIAYLYGTLRTQGRAYATDIRQFAGRGIPIYSELAKVLGVTDDKVKQYVEDGKVGFDEVSKAFANMSAEGGKFANLMQKQSESASGMMSNMKDNFTLAGIALGEAFLPQIKDFIKKGIALGNWIKENTATILKWVKAIGTVIKWFLIFKISVIAVTKTMQAYNAITIVASSVQKVFQGALSGSIKGIGGLNAVMKANLIGAMLTMLTALILKIKELRDETKKVAQTWEDYKIKMLENRELLGKMNFFPKMNVNEQFSYMDEIGSRIEELKSKMAEYSYQSEFATEMFKSFQERSGIYSENVSNAKKLTKEYKEYLRLSRESWGAESRLMAAESDLKLLQETYKKVQTLMFGKKRPGALGIGVTAKPDEELKKTITAAAPKVFNINIDKLVENMNFKSEMVATDSGRTSVKKELENIFLEMLADVQINYARV